MNRIIVAVAIACAVSLGSHSDRAQAADSTKWVPSVLGLLLGEEKNEGQDCPGHDPILIRSIQAERYVPYAPVTIAVENIGSISPTRSVITFNNLQLPILDMDYAFGTVTTLLPNLPGTVQVSLNSPCAATTNSSQVTIGALGLPPGATVEGVLSTLSAELLAYQVNLQTEADNPEYGAEQRAGFARLTLEFEDSRLFLEYLLNDVATQAEKLEAAALLVHYLGTVPGTEAAQSPAARVSSSTLEVSPVSPNSVGPTWEAINARRILLEHHGVLSALTDWRTLGVLTSTNPVLQVMETVLTYAKITLAVAGLRPALLDQMTVEVGYPAGGLYVDSMEAPVVCKGTFIPNAAVFYEDLVNMLLSKVIEELINLQYFSGISKDYLARYDGSNVKNTLFGYILQNRTLAFLEAPLNKFAEDFGRAFANKGEKAENVEFPCTGGVKLTRTAIHKPLHVVAFIWENPNSSLRPIAIGSNNVTLLFNDGLREDAGQLISHSFDVTVNNRMPEITNNPECILNSNGVCTIRVNLIDRDQGDTTWAKLTALDSLKEGMASAVSSSQDTFLFSYTSMSPREVYTDVIKINYGDNHNSKVLYLPVGGYIPEECTYEILAGIYTKSCVHRYPDGQVSHGERYEFSDIEQGGQVIIHQFHPGPILNWSTPAAKNVFQTKWNGWEVHFPSLHVYSYIEGAGNRYYCEPYGYSYGFEDGSFQHHFWHQLINDQNYQPQVVAVFPEVICTGSYEDYSGCKAGMTASLNECNQAVMNKHHYESLHSFPGTCKQLWDHEKDGVTYSCPLLD